MTKDNQIFFRITENQYKKLVTLAFLKGKRNPNQLMKDIALELIDKNADVITKADDLKNDLQ